MKNVFHKFTFILLLVFAITGCSISEKNSVIEKNIRVMVYDGNSNIIYDENIITSQEFLDSELKNNEKLEFVTENGPYGDYIKSIMGIAEKSDKNYIYYWAFYINDNYAEVGISSCKIKNDNIYSFKYEKYES